jgi:trk system potassium uptake protein TrkA
MAQRTAMRYSTRGAFDYIELTPEYALLEIEVPKSWIGKNLVQLNIRTKYNINVIGRKNGDKVTPVIDVEKTFDHGEHLIVAGNKRDLLKMMDHV